MAAKVEPFWKRKTLAQLDQDEWESLCDGCGLCCLQKLEDEDDNSVYYTRIACKLLDLKTCQCTDYPNRRDFVPDCIQLTPGKADEFKWLPPTCGYRLVSEGKDLPPVEETPHRTPWWLLLLRMAAAALLILPSLVTNVWQMRPWPTLAPMTRRLCLCFHWLILMRWCPIARRKKRPMWRWANPIKPFRGLMVTSSICCVVSMRGWADTLAPQCQ